MPALRTAYLWILLVVAAVALVTGMAARSPVRPSVPSLTGDSLADLGAAVSSLDEELERLWNESRIVPAGPADELIVLRRLSLALHGTIPALEEIRRFEADDRPDRLKHWTAAMLEDPRFDDYFAERLARAYVGVEKGQFLIFRRDRFKDWLSQQLRQHTPYDDLVRAMISGQGVWTGDGEVNFVTAGFANEEFDANTLTARTVRAFLGQRMDCAQCHDHPFDHWKQQDFEGLAAHFGQVELSLAGVVDQQHVLFKIPEAMAGAVGEGPVPAALRKLFGRHKHRLNDGAAIRLVDEGCLIVTEPVPDERATPAAMQQTSRSSDARTRFVLRRTSEGIEVREPDGEYFVEDRITLEDRLVEPAVPFHPEWLGKTGTRRERLAEWIVHPDNARFERAIANRVWGLMFGRPFVPDRPVDDLPDPGTEEDLRVLDLLGADFRAHGCDLRRLVQVIAASRAFRISSVHPRDAGVESLAPEAAEARAAGMERIRDRWGVFPLVRLRPEQVIGAMLQANYLHPVDQKSHLFVRFLRFVREKEFVDEFGDPGVDEFTERAGTIPQALLRMNGELAKELTELNPLTAPGRINLTASSPENLLETAYLVCLTRRPTDAEKQYFLAELTGEHRRGDKNAAVQDLFWTLFNSPEFSWNH